MTLKIQTSISEAIAITDITREILEINGEATGQASANVLTVS
jgi:hypothetical protein